MLAVFPGTVEELVSMSEPRPPPSDVFFEDAPEVTDALIDEAPVDVDPVPPPDDDVHVEPPPDDDVYVEPPPDDVVGVELPPDEDVCFDSPPSVEVRT